MDLEVKKLEAPAKLPTYAYDGDAGLDIYALEAVSLPAAARVSVRTGIALAIPEGYVGLICDRSGLAAKYGIHHLAGVIDSGYRGEVIVVLLNTSATDYKIAAGDKIAQLLVQPVEQVEVIAVSHLPDSPRAESGFGSTGK